MSEIVGFFTTSLHIPLNEDTKILRARSYKVNRQETYVSELSYITQRFSDKVILGRLNREKQPVYYGCIYFGDTGGVNEPSKRICKDSMSESENGKNRYSCQIFLRHISMPAQNHHTKLY